MTAGRSIWSHLGVDCQSNTMDFQSAMQTFAEAWAAAARARTPEGQRRAEDAAAGGDDRQPMEKVDNPQEEEEAKSQANKQRQKSGGEDGEEDPNHPPSDEQPLALQKDQVQVELLQPSSNWLSKGINEEEEEEEKTKQRDHDQMAEGFAFGLSSSPPPPPTAPNGSCTRSAATAATSQQQPPSSSRKLHRPFEISPACISEGAAATADVLPAAAAGEGGRKEGKRVPIFVSCCIIQSSLIQNDHTDEVHDVKDDDAKDSIPINGLVCNNNNNNNSSSSNSNSSIGPLEILLEIPSEIPFAGLVTNVLLQIGFKREEICAATGELLVANWKPLKLSEICEESEQDKRTVQDILGQVAAVPTIRIVISYKKLATSEVRQRVMSLLLDQYYRDLRLRGFLPSMQQQQTDAKSSEQQQQQQRPFSFSRARFPHQEHQFYDPVFPWSTPKHSTTTTLAPEYPAPPPPFGFPAVRSRSPIATASSSGFRQLQQRLSDDCNRNMGGVHQSFPDGGTAAAAAAAEQQQQQPQPAEEVSSGGGEARAISASAALLSSSSRGHLMQQQQQRGDSYLITRPRMRICFDPETEIPRLQKWFSENHHPTRQQVESYVSELNSLECRRGRKSLDVNNVIYWFKNTRAAVKRAELKTRHLQDAALNPHGGNSGSNWPPSWLSSSPAAAGFASYPYSNIASSSSSSTAASGGGRRLLLLQDIIPLSSGLSSVPQGSSKPGRSDAMDQRNETVHPRSSSSDDGSSEEEEEDAVNEKCNGNGNGRRSERGLREHDGLFAQEVAGSKSPIPILAEDEDDDGRKRLSSPSSAGSMLSSPGGAAGSEERNRNTMQFSPSFLYAAAAAANPLLGHMYMSQYVNPFLQQQHQSSSSSFLGLGGLLQHQHESEKRKRNRTFIDPVSEVPRLEQWFSSNTHPSHAMIARFTDELNRLPYRHKFPRLEQKNIQFWFKNRRAKCKRMSGNGGQMSHCF